MGVNKHKEHVLVVPEDDATRQLANGFLLYPSLDGTCIDIRPPSGGWRKVLDEFREVHVRSLRQYRLRHLVLLIDFDDVVDERTKQVQSQVPADVSERVYILGAHSEPEPLRRSIGQSFEKIGTGLAKSCAESSPGWWDHDLLKHNQAELARLTANVKPFLFR